MKRLWKLYCAYDDLIWVYLWMVLAIPTVLWWKDSILWVALMSIYANVKASHGAWKAEQAKRNSEE